MVIRKSAQKIKDEILLHLRKGACSTKRLGDLLGSNWSTINAHLDELKQENKVRELYSKENLRVYVRVDYPVYYGLPLDERRLNDSLFLLSEIVRQWKEIKGVDVCKTTMQKIAVNVARNNPDFNIPVIRFHYGKVLPAFMDQESFLVVLDVYGVGQPVNQREIERVVGAEVESGRYTNIAWMDKKRQYEEYEDMKIFLIKDELSYSLSKANNPKRLLDLFAELFLKIPSDERYSYLFEKFNDFIGTADSILNSNEFVEGSEEEKKNYLKEISETLNPLWQALTTEFFFEDMETQINPDFKDIMQFIRDSKIKTYQSEAEEKLGGLSEYKKVLTPKSGEVGRDERKIIEILTEGAGEE